MICMRMGHEDRLDSKAALVAHHLALGPFPAIKQEEISLSLDCNAADVAPDRRPGGSGSEKGEANHGVPAEISAGA
jgi:hypothetical protein